MDNTAPTTPARPELHLAYRRVSTVDQSTQRQLDGLGITFNREYEDKASAKDVERPALQRLLDDVDLLASVGAVTLHVHSLDRLARNLGDLEALVQQLTGKGVTVMFHKEGLRFDAGAPSAMQTLLLQMLGAVAQFERALIRERQREGIAVAKTQPGKYKGRAYALTAQQAQELRELAHAGTSKVELAKRYGISRASVYAYLTA